MWLSSKLKTASKTCISVKAEMNSLEDIGISHKQVILSSGRTCSVSLTQPTANVTDHDQEKKFVREAYKNILPDFVIDRRKLNGRKDYWGIWKDELQQIYPNEKPRSEEDVIALLNLFVTKEWLKTHDVSINEATVRAT
jgi:hypothetical protein